MSQSEITARIAQFTNELEALVRSAALDAVRQALGAAPSSAPRAARPASAPRRGPGRPRKLAVAQPAAQPVSAPIRGPGRPRKIVAPQPTTAAAAPAAKLPTAPKKGAKRTPEQLAQIDTAIRGFVKTHPGTGVELMAKNLGVPSKDLKGRISLLIDGKKLRKTGQKRATKYFAA